MPENQPMSDDDLVYIRYGKNPDESKTSKKLPNDVSFPLWGKNYTIQRGGCSAPLKRIDAQSVVARSATWEIAAKLTIEEIVAPASELAESKA